MEDGEQVLFKNRQAVLKKVPQAVFVKFPDAKWTLPGMEEPGLYPIVPRRAKWHLDHGRQHPVLGVTRRQLPLAPAFAVTAHVGCGVVMLLAVVLQLDARTRKAYPRLHRWTGRVYVAAGVGALLALRWLRSSSGAGSAQQGDPLMAAFIDSAS